MEKLMLMDGHSILNRAYFALPSMSNKEGIHTNAVYGFLNIMFKFLEDEKPDYLAIAFDVHAPTFRHEMYKEYKGNRKGMDDELREQVPIIQEMLTKMGIPVIKKEGLEADDILGTISKKAQSKGLSVTIVSGDRDLLQIADDNIKISIPKTKQGKTEVEEYFKQDVYEKIGVSPTEFIDVKALWGDSSDNIPGVPGIGQKGAVAIISKYKSIENAYSDVDNVTPKRASENLKEYIEQARLSKILATIKTDCELDFELEAARYTTVFTKESYELCKTLELKSILKRFPSDITEEIKTIDKEIKASILEEKSVKEALLELGKIANKVIGVVISSDNNSLCLAIDDKAVIVSDCNIKEQIGELYKASDAIISSYDIKEYLIPLFVDIDEYDSNRFFDVKLAEYLLDPTRSDYSLNSAGLGIEQEALECFKVHKEYNNELKKLGLDSLYYDIELPLAFTLAKMEREGIYLDTEALGEYNKLLTDSIVKFENEIYGECGEIFNINSPKQLGEILFEKMGIPGGKKTKTGYSTAADVLEKLAPDYPVINKILQFRQYSKLKSTYAEGLSECVGEDGRIHTNFKQTVTSTGRLSSTNPNLQNIPIRTELGRVIRKVFKAKEGYVFIDADYSQIELRVLAHMSGDENLIEAYKENKDIHRATAAKVFGKPFEEVTDIERSNAKAVNFGIVYGISSFGLGNDLNISRKEAQKYIDDYYKAYPSLKLYLDSLIEYAKKTGYALTMYGRRRPIPELKSKNFMQRSFGERISMNTPIQGSAADIIKIAMINVDKRLKENGFKARLILQVHDELLIESPIEEKEDVIKLLKDEMESATNLKVPLIADVHSGSTWFEAK